MIKIKFIGIYLRLSKEDNEKESIEGQRKIITEYIKEHKEFYKYEIKEYMDNGYSGKNMKRPEMERLLSDCARGEIKCIMVKDLSRFGRNYIENGEYIEKIFPLMGIRFIAVNDNYDSIKNENEETKIKIILNDFYRRDISEKIKKCIEIKKKRGEYKKCIYGYKKEKGIIVIDREKKKNIEMIFENGINGLKARETAKMLNERGILSPSGKKGGWCIENIWKILRDERYCEDIIKRDVFEEIQRKYKKRKYIRKREKRKIKIICGECGYCMRKGRCGRYNINTKEECREIYFDDNDYKYLCNGIKKNILIWNREEEKNEESAEKKRRELQKMIDKMKEEKIKLIINGKEDESLIYEEKINELKEEAGRIKNNKIDFFENMTGRVIVYREKRVEFSPMIFKGVTM